MRFSARLIPALLTAGLIFSSTTAFASTREEAQRRQFSGLIEFLENRIREGSTEEIETAVRALQTNPIPRKAREPLTDGLETLAIRHHLDEILKSLRELPDPVAAPAGPARPFDFPRDHGSHRGSFSEWWYFNGNLEAGDREFGYELTFFRTAIRVNFVHTAVTDLGASRHPFERKYTRSGACVIDEDVLNIEFGKHKARVDVDGSFRIQFEADGSVVDLTLVPERGPMIVNGDGVIDMPEGTSSRYYSFTKLVAKGTIRTPEGEILEVKGASWFDHQWGNFVSFFRPWDWFSFQMEDGTEYNLFHFRDALGFSGRTCINKLSPAAELEMSRKMTLSRDVWWKSPRSGDWFVTKWTLELPDLGERFVVSTPQEDQEMPRVGWWDVAPAYWEGTISIVRTDRDGKLIKGIGYAEHFPYSRPRFPLPGALQLGGAHN